MILKFSSIFLLQITYFLVVPAVEAGMIDEYIYQRWTEGREMQSKWKIKLSKQEEYNDNKAKYKAYCSVFRELGGPPKFQDS